MGFAGYFLASANTAQVFGHGAAGFAENMRLQSA